ncbi:hypothetical protein O1611_g2192 [Lasiodiplodia mahajangana]|uniref:Uncharacterized protein n=1 Tax=Lasiodiplodia mahajangana TaxID=1108764 RepID=A0ACC2JVQ6_9PEZI|nr:hypothetical protein O1611_g2192 [Lasiodiplodia mahajangana]
MSIPADRQDTFARATVWSHNVNQFTSLEQDRLEGGTGVVISENLTSDNVKDSDKWLNALENIQSSRTAIVTGDEIDEAIQFRFDALPDNIKRLIYMLSANSAHHGLWDKDHYPRTAVDDVEDAMQEEFDNFIERHGARLEKILRSYPYHLWPINAGGHWMIVFVVLEKSESNPEIYNRLAGFAIVDPWLSGGKTFPGEDDYDEESYRRSNFVSSILNSMLGCARLETNHDDYVRNERRIWVPTQEADDNWSSGLRVIDFVWEMIRRIQDMELSGIRNIDSLFRPMRPYFNPDYVRLDAAGAIASRGVRWVGYQGRIVLARVNAISSRTRQDKRPRDPRDLMAPLPSHQAENIPQKFLEGGISDLERTLDAFKFTAPVQNASGRQI